MQQSPKESASKSKRYNHSYIVSLFALVGTSITGVMGFIGLLNNNFILASVLFLVSLSFFIGYYIHKKFQNIELCSSTIIYSLYFIMFYLVYAGGVDNTGPLWIFMVAPVSVFILGLKRGLVHLTVFVIIISAIMFIPTDNVIRAIYSTEFKLRLIYSFLTVVFSIINPANGE